MENNPRKPLTSAEISSLLVDVHEEILADNPESYYSHYRTVEVYTWQHIAFWLAEELTQRVNMAVPFNLLDIGCAYGSLLAFSRKIGIPWISLYGIDFKTEFLNTKTRMRNLINFQKANVEIDEIPWDGVKFDIIILTEVMEHFNFNPVGTLKRIANRLSPGGTIYLSTPDPSEWVDNKRYETYRNMPEPDSSLPIEDDHIHLYSKDELIEIFDIVGLKIVKSEFAPGKNDRHFNFALAKKAEQVSTWRLT